MLMKTHSWSHPLVFGVRLFLYRLLDFTNMIIGEMIQLVGFNRKKGGHDRRRSSVVAAEARIEKM